MININTRIQDRILVLATAGAARFGMTLEQALASSFPFLPPANEPAHRAPKPETTEEKPPVIDGLAALRALRAELKQS